jgi:hypothetical protein
MIVTGNIYAGLNSSGGGGTVTTANGISGNGSVGTPVILGGPLNQATTILLTGQVLTFDDTTTSTTGEVSIRIGDSTSEGQAFLDVFDAGIDIQTNGPGTTQLSDFSLSPSEIRTRLVGRTDNNATGIIEVSEFTPNQPQIILATSNGVTGQSIFLQQANTAQPISITDDLTGIGMEAFADYSTGIIANGNAYTTTTAVKKIIGSFNAAIDSAGNTVSKPALVSFVVPSGDGMFLCSGYTLYRSGLGSVAITVGYTDVLGNPQTIGIGVTPCSAANTNTAYSPIFIKAKAGTTVVINWVLTGAMTYDAGGVIQFLGS